MDPERAIRLVREREEVFRELRVGPRSKGALVAALPVSRSTVDRALRELEGAGLVTRAADGYRLTLVGRLLLDRYGAFGEEVGGLVAAAPLLEPLPPDAPLSPAVLRGASTVGATGAAPYEPLDATLGVVRGADRVRLVATTGLTHYAGLGEGEGLWAEGTTAEIGLPPDALGRLVAERPPWFDRAVDADRVTLLELDSEPPFAAALVGEGGDRRVVVTVFDGGEVRGCLTNDRRAAVEWGEAFVADHLDAATTLRQAER